MSGAPDATVHLVDASPYIFRAFHALPKSIRDPEGAPANAIYGFASFLVKYLTDARPTHIAIAFDQNLTGSFRNATLASYKAARPPPPAELEMQIPCCLEAARALGLKAFIDPEYEADDLIATMHARLARAGRKFVIVTIDKDLAQLVSADVVLHDPGRAPPLAPQGVFERYGVRPEQVLDWLALAGDAVDGIPGLPGVGAKTAADLLSRFGDLEAIYRSVPALRASPSRRDRTLAQKLEEHMDMVAMSREMATLARDAPISVSMRDLRYRGIHEPELRALFARLGFRTLATRLLPAPGKPAG